MVQPDWNRILSVNLASLSDEEIEDICPMVIQCEGDDIDDLHNLRALFKLSQEMLQYKDHQVESLLLECSELKQAISALKPEASKRRKKDHVASQMKQDVEVFGKRSSLSTNSDYEDALKGKNKKISTLMQELESLDKENELIKNQLTSLGEEMRDATEKMNEMTEELSSVRMKNSEYKENITVLEYKNAALVAQIEEITSQQVDRDKVIDDFGAAIDNRVSEWKNILDEKDAEIIHLRKNLSQYLLRSTTSVMEENESIIVELKEDIKQRDKIIIELQSKLSEATVEINNGVTLIEQLKADAKKSGKDDARNKESKLLSMLEDANEKVSTLETAFIQVQNDLKLKSSDLCEALSVIRKYENGNDGLTQALDEIKDLKHEIDRKNEHIEDLVNVVNKLEMLNCYQEMEIITLREKLGIPEDKSVSIENTVVRCNEEASRLEKLVQENKVLVEENLEMKSDIRILKYQLYKSATTSDISHKTLNDSTNFLHSTKLLESDQNGVLEAEHLPLHHKTYVDELKKNIQIVIEENEALRTGMHEILDSIRDQDGEFSRTLMVRAL